MAKCNSLHPLTIHPGAELTDVDVCPACCQATLPTFRSLFGRVQGHFVYIWAMKHLAATSEPSCSYICYILAPGLALLRLVSSPRACPANTGLRLTLIAASRLDPDAWCSASRLPCCHPRSLDVVLLLWVTSTMEALEPDLKMYSSTLFASRKLLGV